jgi:hypothetical protein
VTALSWLLVLGIVLLWLAVAVLVAVVVGRTVRLRDMSDRARWDRAPNNEEN